MNILVITLSIIFVLLLMVGSFFIFMNQSQFKNKSYSKVLIISLFILALSILIFCISLDYILDTYQNPTGFNKDFEKIGQYGDFFGGILNPIIGFVGILAASLAFYAQYDANKQVKDQFKIQQFESQFYTMLNLHKENVEKLYLKISKKDNNKNVTESYINGRIVFEYLLPELHVIFIIATNHYSNNNAKTILKKAYDIFFNGFNTNDFNKDDFSRDIDNTLLRINSSNTIPQDIWHIINEKQEAISKKMPNKIEYPYFKGHVHQLAHYYRHLFQTVKFIANQPESFISYNQKRNYLRILRSQLSNSEQVLLFYNWYSGFGKQWENSTNKFFSDYRMIHNIHQELLISTIQLKDIFDLNNGYRKEVGRDSDNLFEFQDWN